jgi:hypothetical protein
MVALKTTLLWFSAVAVALMTIGVVWLGTPLIAWLVVACAASIVVTVVLVRNLIAGKPVAAEFRKWLWAIIDFFSGGG